MLNGWCYVVVLCDCVSRFMLYGCAQVCFMVVGVWLYFMVSAVWLYFIVGAVWLYFMVSAVWLVVVLCDCVSQLVLYGCAQMCFMVGAVWLCTSVLHGCCMIGAMWIFYVIFLHSWCYVVVDILCVMWLLIYYVLCGCAMRFLYVFMLCGFSMCLCCMIGVVWLVLYCFDVQLYCETCSFLICGRLLLYG